jgi:predicted MFS family arabinose efflux permease
MFALATNLWMFATAAVLYWIFTMFVYILLLGTAALLDPTGRLGTFGTGCERLAFAIGAPLGGLMVDYGSYVWVGVAAAIACSVIAPAFLPGLARALAAGSSALSGSHRKATLVDTP